MCGTVYGEMHLKKSPGIIRKSRVSYPGPGSLSSATWPSLPKKHYNGLNQLNQTYIWAVLMKVDLIRNRYYIRQTWLYFTSSDMNIPMLLFFQSWSESTTTIMTGFFRVSRAYLNMLQQCVSFAYADDIKTTTTFASRIATAIDSKLLSSEFPPKQLQNVNIGEKIRALKIFICNKNSTLFMIAI